MPIIIRMATALQRYGQSIWLDFISRKMVTAGELARLVRDEGVVGVTSNPTIFEKAIVGTDDYAAQIEAVRRAEPELPARQLYERLVVKDIQDVADILRETYDRRAVATGTSASRFRPGSRTTPTRPCRRRATCGRRSRVRT